MSFWQDEESMASWRNVVQHRLVQKAGREEYRITVVSPLRSYGLEERSQAPGDSNSYFGLE